MVPSSWGAGRRRDLLVSGHVNVDRFLRVRRFPSPDRTVPVVGERVALGGTATTIARVAASYGVATGLLSRLGDGFPPEFDRELRRSQVDLAGIERVPGEPTPTCYILEDERHEQRTLIQQGPMGDAGGAGLPTAALPQYAWLHLTTGDPRRHLALAAAARKVGTRIAVDPAQEVYYRWERGTLLKLLDGAEILFGSHHEIQRAAQLAGVHRPAALLDLVPLVVRTEGRDGATAFSRAGTVEVGATKVRKVRSLVGAGDAFRGGFYAGWFAGEDLAHCLKAGTRAAAHWIESGPAGFPPRRPGRR